MHIFSLTSVFHAFYMFVTTILHAYMRVYLFTIIFPTMFACDFVKINIVQYGYIL